MAPSLHSVIRKTLEAKQISAEDIDSYLKDLKSIQRYDSAFKTLWAICFEKRLPLDTITIYQLASQILYLNQFSPSQARNAYSAMLLIPGWDQLRFCPLLHTCKRTWNTSQAKYSTFWDAENVLKKLCLQPLNWQSIQAVRDRLILACRLLNLFRSVDLARTWRCHSSIGDQFYILTQRKNQKKPQWEALLRVPGQPVICPVTLIKHYVAMTAHQAPSGSLLLRQIKPPYAPLSNNTVGSITRNLLQQFGIPTSFWGPHSTRGAGVQLYKKLGLSSEEVCEIGKWKNINAFTAHYSRLGASEKASLHIGQLVHKVSPIQSVESDWSSTPRTQELGGRDQEDETQSVGEPTHPAQVIIDSENGKLSPNISPGTYFAEDFPFLVDAQQGLPSGSMSPLLDSAMSSSVPKAPLHQPLGSKKGQKIRPRESGESPPRKFKFATRQNKEKQD
jgi:hypothetical protein